MGLGRASCSGEVSPAGTRWLRLWSWMAWSRMRISSIWRLRAASILFTARLSTLVS